MRARGPTRPTSATRSRAHFGWNPQAADGRPREGNFPALTPDDQQAVLAFIHQSGSAIPREIAKHVFRAGPLNPIVETIRTFLEQSRAVTRHGRSRFYPTPPEGGAVRAHDDAAARVETSSDEESGPAKRARSEKSP